MNPIFAAALEVQALCTARGWRGCAIGGLAVQRWGEPRLTQDADFLLHTGVGGEAGYVDALLERFRGRGADARGFALRHRVVLCESAAGVPIDLALGATPFEGRVVARAGPFPLPGSAGFDVCGAEDLLALKTLAGRDKDWLDVEGIALRQAGRLDQPLVWAELTPLLELKHEPEAADRLRDLLEAARA